jgi:hypothetical protein
VAFAQAKQQYPVLAHQPGTINIADIDIVCGMLAASLQVAGTRVLVSGTFKEYNQAPPTPAFVSYTYYRLSIRQLALR